MPSLAKVNGKTNYKLLHQCQTTDILDSSQLKLPQVKPRLREKQEYTHIMARLLQRRAFMHADFQFLHKFEAWTGGLEEDIQGSRLEFIENVTLIQLPIDGCSLPRRSQASRAHPSLSFPLLGEYHCSQPPARCD